MSETTRNAKLRNGQAQSMSLEAESWLSRSKSGVGVVLTTGKSNQQAEEGQNLEWEKFSEAFTMPCASKKKRSKFCKLKSILIKSTCSGITLPLGWIHIIHMHVYVLYMYTYVLYVHSTTICTIVESPRRVSYLLLCPRVLICKNADKIVWEEHSCPHLRVCCLWLISFHKVGV